jgi:hypothetical protein
MIENKNTPECDTEMDELNVYYEEIISDNNPFNSIHNPELYAQIMNRKIKYSTKMKYGKDGDINHMPNQKWHKIVSFIKSGVRIIGYGLIPFNLTIACIVLIFSELIGIVEEMV